VRDIVIVGALLVAMFISSASQKTVPQVQVVATGLRVSVAPWAIAFRISMSVAIVILGMFPLVFALWSPWAASIFFLLFGAPFLWLALLNIRGARESVELSESGVIIRKPFRQIAIPWSDVRLDAVRSLSGLTILGSQGDEVVIESATQDVELLEKYLLNHVPPNRILFAKTFQGERYLIRIPQA